MKNSDLGNRMKKYENISRIYLTQRMPLIIRIDGKAFHNYTSKFKKPFDINICHAFIEASKFLFKNIQGIKLIYNQSDELSILINDYEKFETQSWFDKNLQKIVSISSSITTAYFNNYIQKINYTNKIALFDSRAFVVPKEDVCNYFIWRMLDAERNSVSSLAQSKFSHKQLQGKSCKQMKDMLLKEMNCDWDKIDSCQKRGWCFDSENGIDFDIPRFNEDRYYINKFLKQLEE